MKTEEQIKAKRDLYRQREKELRKADNHFHAEIYGLMADTLDDVLKEEEK